MTPEEMERMLQKHDEALARIERNVELVTNQQAQFYSDLQGLTARLDGFEKAAEQARARQEASISNLTELVDRLISAQLRLVEGIDRMTDVTEQRLNALAEAQKAAEERLNALAEAQKATEDHLRSLIALVARYISGRNGGDAPR